MCRCPGRPIAWPCCRPAWPARPFTNRELGSALRQPAALGAQMTYCLRQMGALSVVGKRGRAALHDLAPEMSV